MVTLPLLNFFLSICFPVSLYFLFFYHSFVFFFFRFWWVLLVFVVIGPHGFMFSFFNFFFNFWSLGIGVLCVYLYLLSYLYYWTVYGLLFSYDIFEVFLSILSFYHRFILLISKKYLKQNTQLILNKLKYSHFEYNQFYGGNYSWFKKKFNFDFFW